MSRMTCFLTTALLFALLAAAPANARVISFGTSTANPATTCVAAINQVDCTVHGERIPSSGRLTTVRIGHAAPEGTTTLKVKLMRELSDGTPQLVRDIGDVKTVASASTSTEWVGLAESVTVGQFLAFFVDNPTSDRQLRMATSDGGNGVTFYGGEITTEGGWPYASLVNWGTNLRGVVRTPPVTTIDSGPSGFTQDGTPSFAYSADESAVTFECSLDNGAYAGCSANGYQASPLSDGTHVFSVRATNDIGQLGPATSRTFTVDRTPPDTAITSGPNGVETADTRPTFTFSSDEAGSFECSLDGGAFLPCPTPAQPASELADGPHRLEVRAVDQAGNIDPTPAVATFTVKRAVPPAPAPAPPPAAAPAAWGIPFAGQSWTFADGADSLGGPSTDIESIQLVYDAAGRFGVLVRFRAAGPRKVWVDLHRSLTCTDYSKELWVSTDGQPDSIWSVASMNGVQFVGGRTSGDGREILVTIEDPRVAGLALRCLSVRSVAGAETVDTLTASLVGRAAPPYIPPREEIVVIMRRSLGPVVQLLERSTPRQLARKRVHTVHVQAPGPGSVGVEWTVPAAVAKRYGVRTKRGARTVSLAVGARKVTQATKKVAVNVKLTPAGRKVLRKAKRLKVVAHSGYLPQGGQKLLAATRAVQVGKKSR